jgi:alkylation response protein AidB-like acyl-CoA dehydrogenase
MDFSLTEQQQMFRDSVAAFARRELSEGALERAHNAQFPHEVAKKMAQAGLLGITLPEADGGAGGTLMDAVLAIETVATVCPRSADVIQEGNFGAIRVLAHFANADQKKRYLAPLLKGEEVIAVAMTEPEAGSATTDLVTSATPDGAGYRINGRKVFPNPHADQYLVYVRYGPGGFKKQIAGFNAERIGNAARSLAYGRYCYMVAREYAMTRKQFGRPLCEFQGLQWKFADMKMKLEAAQLLLYRAAVNADRGFPAADETTVAKLMCNQTGFEVANEAMQVMGGLGYTQETLVEYCLRRCRGWMLAGGSIEMMKNRLAEIIFERRFSQRPPKPATA